MAGLLDGTAGQGRAAAARAAGEHFDFEDEERMRRLLPRLTGVFYDGDER
jgi:hypothetical protein